MCTSRKMSKRKAKKTRMAACNGAEEGCECGQAGTANDADAGMPRAAQGLGLCSPGASKCATWSGKPEPSRVGDLVARPHWRQSIRQPSQPARHSKHLRHVQRASGHWLLGGAGACARRGCAPNFSCLAHDEAPEFLKPAHTGTISSEPWSLGMQQEARCLQG